jgi:hypothetical protein
VVVMLVVVGIGGDCGDWWRWPSTCCMIMTVDQQAQVHECRLPATLWQSTHLNFRSLATFHRLTDGWHEWWNQQPAARGQLVWDSRLANVHCFVATHSLLQ